MRGERRSGRAVLGAALLLAAVVAAGNTRSEAPGGPRIELEATEVDLGRVPNDRAVEKVFQIHNRGTKPLVITRVATSCGCTAAMMESSVVEPGQRGRLRVSFNPKGMRQRVTRTVSVYSNDPVSPTVQLRLSADVVEAGAKDEPEAAPRRAHPPEKALSLEGRCAKCHAPRKAGETGAVLYASMCAMCHGKSGEGVRFDREIVGTPLRPAQSSVKSRAGLRQVIAAGTGHPYMPGFGREYGGPLTDAQVASLVDLILGTFPDR